MSNARTVLLVDDEEISNFINAKVIDRAGFATETNACQSVDAGLQFLLDNIHGEQEKIPDVIFLDIKMPGRDGWDFLEAFAGISEKIKKKIKIYMLSSSVYDGDKMKAKSNRHVDGYINKPLTESALEDL